MSPSFAGAEKAKGISRARASRKYANFMKSLLISYKEHEFLRKTLRSKLEDEVYKLYHVSSLFPLGKAFSPQGSLGMEQA